MDFLMNMVDVVVDKLWWKKSVAFVDWKSNNVGFLIIVNVFFIVSYSMNLVYMYFYNKYKHEGIL